MNLLETYLIAIDFSQNALKSIIHRYKIQTYLDINSIPVTVAEDLFFKLQEENRVFSIQEIACFCKYHTRHIATCDRKHKCQSLNPYADIQENPVLYKKNSKSVASLRKIDLIKKLTLQGKKNEEIIQITGFARSTVCYLQKQSGLKCVNSRIQYTKEQAEKIKRLSVDFTAKEVGEKIGLTERRVRAIASQEGIRFYHIGGAPKRSKIKNEDEILELYSQGMSGLQIAKRLGINLKTVYKVKQKNMRRQTKNGCNH